MSDLAFSKAAKNRHIYICFNPLGSGTRAKSRSTRERFPPLFLLFFSRAFQNFGNEQVRFLPKVFVSDVFNFSDFFVVIPSACYRLCTEKKEKIEEQKRAKHDSRLDRP